MSKSKINMYPDIREEDLVTEVHEIIVQKVGHVPVAKGDFSKLPKAVKIFISHCVSILNLSSTLRILNNSQYLEQNLKEITESKTNHRI